MPESTSTRGGRSNRLIHETSPYLLQHAHNPVDWYPWGPEAFEAARVQDKPIFLSVGYSTCYWCHVMERQCFEDERIAALMNRVCINIKVDREERPDVDQLYMTAVQILTRQGGWPMSVFLTPDLRPFYAGTYFPPEDMYGRPGFPTILLGVEAAWRDRRAEVLSTCEQLVDVLGQLARPPQPQAPLAIDEELIDRLIDHSTADYDAQHGGFGQAPKFPRQTLLELLLVYLAQAAGRADESTADARGKRIRDMLVHTLDALAQGGIRDHLGGAFHRYSTDAQWLVPHFEIMLYDNAMLAWIYAEACRQFGQRRYAEVARGILDFVLGEMTSPQGAFFTAFDAEVDAMEGKSYLWTPQEVAAVLGEQDAVLFNHLYGLDRGPNFADPHHGSGRPDRNVLYLPESVGAVARRMDLRESDIELTLVPMRRKLYAARRQRKQPLLDTKIITSWNALMIRAMAFAGRTLDEPRYTAAAARAADFLLQHHASPDGGVYRSSREGIARQGGFLDDYAFLAQALLELSRSPGQEHRRAQADALVIQMLERFADREAGGFYFSAADADDLIVRQKVATDSPLPSGNAIAAMVLLELGNSELARDAIAAFAGQIELYADGMSAMIQAAALYLARHSPFTVSPDPARAGQTRPPPPQQRAAGVVSLLAAWVDPAELHIYVDVDRSYHINAHEAAEGLIATQLTVADAADLVEAVEYPPGQLRRLAFADQELRVYSGTITIAVRFRESMSGRPPLRMALTYQACADDVCLPPVTKQFEINAP